MDDNAEPCKKEDLLISEPDWSQFLPGLILVLVGAILGVIINAIKPGWIVATFKKLRKQFGRMLGGLEPMLKRARERWLLMLLAGVLITVDIIFFPIYRNREIALFSLGHNTGHPEDFCPTAPQSDSSCWGKVVPG